MFFFNLIFISLYFWQFFGIKFYFSFLILKSFRQKSQSQSYASGLLYAITYRFNYQSEL